MVSDSTPVREVQSVHGIRHALCPRRGAAVSGFVLDGDLLMTLEVARSAVRNVVRYTAVFGGELLLTYFEPVRIYVAAAGTAILAVAIVIEGRRGLSLAPGQI